MDWYVGTVYPEGGGASKWVEADDAMGAVEAWLRLAYSAGYAWNGDAISAWPSLGDALTSYEDTVTLPRNSLAVHAIVAVIRREFMDEINSLIQE